MSEARILFVEDDAAGRELGSYNLRKAGYDVDAVASGEEALKQFSPEQHALVITDVRMPGISGLDVLRSVKAKAPDVPVLVITAYGSVETAVEAMKQGAADFVGKPFNRDHLLLCVKRALEGDDPVAVGPAIDVMIAARRLDGAFQRLGARIAEKDAVGEGRLAQPAGQFLLVRDFVEVGDVPQLARLRRQRLDEVRMGMAERIDGDAGGEIEIAFARIGHQPRALAMIEGERRAGERLVNG